MGDIQFFQQLLVKFLLHLKTCFLHEYGNVFNQSISQNLYSAPSRYLLRGAPGPGQAEKKSLEGGGIDNRHRLGGALDLLKVHSRFLDQPQKMNGSALSQSGRMGPPN